MTSSIDSILSQQGNDLCLSVIVPTYKYGVLRMLSRGMVDKAINKARKFIIGFDEQHPEKKARKLLIANLEWAASQVASSRFEEGLGIFISPSVRRIIHFPFPVTEKIIIGKSFETRDLFRYRIFASEFYVLSLSKKVINLFRWNEDKLEEVISSDFPVLFTDDYEYSRPSRGTSFGNTTKSFERDKSVLSEVRLKNFFKEADEKLHKYFRDSTPLMVCGVKTQIASFREVTRHNDRIAATINGYYNQHLPTKLTKRLRDVNFKYQMERQKPILDRIEEDFGNQMVVEGLEAVWKAADEGKGLILVIEKDYQSKAYLRPGDRHKLFTSPPAGEYEIVHDAVDDVLEMVQHKGGKIVFVENDKLKKFNHIAMLLRYKNVEQASAA